MSFGLGDGLTLTVTYVIGEPQAILKLHSNLAIHNGLLVSSVCSIAKRKVNRRYWSIE